MAGNPPRPAKPFDATESLDSRFRRLDAKRTTRLDSIRRWSALTDPTILPRDVPVGSDGDNDPLRTAFQSLGGAGLENLTGKTLLALFPPAMPWFKFEPSAQMKWELSGDEYDQYTNFLYAREIQVFSQLETTNYRPIFRKGIANLLVAGDGLVHLGDDYRFRSFRVDRFVFQRDGTGRVYRVMVHEPKRIEGMTDAELERFSVPRGVLMGAADADGKVPLVTEALRQPDGETWIVRQELNGEHRAEPSEEPVCPFLAAGYIEVDGEDYARSFIELRAGDLRSLNALSKAILDAAVAISRLVPVYDIEKGYRASDMLQPNGKPVGGRVTGGLVDGMGFLQSGKSADLSVALNLLDRIENRLSTAMLQVAGAVRDADRVTAMEYAGLRQELNGALGGVYAKIADEWQRTLLSRLVYQMEKDNLLVALTPEQRKTMRMYPMTGMAALSRDAELERWLRGLQFLATLPPEAGLGQLHLDRVAERVLGLMTLDTTGLKKTPEELKQEFEQKMQQQMQQEAGSQAIQSMGEMIEQQAAGGSAA